MAAAVALDTILLGAQQVVRGESVPDSFIDPFGNEQPVDVERLLELGVAAKPGSADAKTARADLAGQVDESADEPESQEPGPAPDEPDGDETAPEPAPVEIGAAREESAGRKRGSQRSEE